MRSDKFPTLIALVATAMMVGGERVVIEAGQPLPDMSEKDAKDLIDAKAARAPIDETSAAPAAASAADPGSTEPDASEKSRPPAKKTAAGKT